MELDKRIKEGKRPLTCFDLKEAGKFEGKEGYFSDYPRAFADGEASIDQCTTKGILKLDECSDNCPYINKTTCSNYPYFLPAEWVKEPEEPKKYRPYTKHEFLNKFECGKPINIRRKDDCINFFIETMPSVKIDNLSDDVHVRLFEGIFNLKRLFDEFEWQKSNGEWQPFGVEE